MSARSRLRLAARVLATAVILVPVSLFNVATTASAASGFVVTATVDGRTAKDMTNHAYPNRYPAGSSVSVVCQDTGPVTYGGSTIWDYTSDQLWVVDYYVKTGYSGFDPYLARCDASNSPAAPDPVATDFAATATLDGRTAKDMANHAYPNKYPQGSTVSIVCQDTGPATYYGSTVWDYTIDGLWVTDYYVRTGYSGFNPSLPRCGDGGTPTSYGSSQFLVSATLDGRTAKDLNNHAYPDRYPAGTRIGVTCQDLGPDAYGSPVWDYTTDSLWVVDKYVRTGYSSFDPKLPRCSGSGTPQPPPSSSAARQQIVQAARSQLGVYPEHNRDNCEPYFTNFGTPYHCGEPWCAYFASWVWRQAGAWTANFGGTNQFYYWGASKGLLRDFAHINPGDVVLYGSGPTSTQSSVHMGVVENVYTDGTISTIEGNWSDGVVRKDHMDPNHTGWEPIYAVVSPFADGTGAGTPPPLPSGNAFPATATIDGRTAKDMSNHAYPDNYPVGTLITVKCQDSGPVTYGGSTVWDYTSDNLWVVDYYVKTGYTDFDPDLPRCSTSPTPPAQQVNPAYQEAMNTYFGSDTWFPLTKVFQATGGGSDSDLIMARAFIQPGQFTEWAVSDRGQFSDRVVDSARAVFVWEPKTGKVAEAIDTSCLVSCAGPLPLVTSSLPIPLGTECDGAFHPFCAARYDYNKVGITSGAGNVTVGFQLANGFSNYQSFPLISPGTIDGAVSIQQSGGSYNLSLSADQFPSWEFLRIPHYNSTGTYETHIFGTRGQAVLPYLCTLCYGQTTVSAAG